MLGLDPATGGMERYADLGGKIDAGGKKIPKIYHLAVHPTRWVQAGPAGRVGGRAVAPTHLRLD